MYMAHLEKARIGLERTAAWRSTALHECFFA